MERSIDAQLQQIKGLHWLPWIGEKYLSQPLPHKLLIIRESLNHEETKSSNLAHQDCRFTRQAINEIVVNRNYNDSLTYKNLHNTIFGHDKGSIKGFWDHVAFLHFIQQPIGRIKSREAMIQIVKGWIVFFKMFNILKPTACLILGTESADYIHGAIGASDYFHLENRTIWFEKNNGTYPTKIIIRYNKDKRLKFLFIKPPGNRYSTDKWHQFVRNEMPDEMKWLDGCVGTAQL